MRARRINEDMQIAAVHALKDLAHQTVPPAVLDAYGWPHDLGEEAILERLLALNLERAVVTTV